MIDTVEPEIKRRAVRRHHKERMKQKARHIFKDIWHDKYMLTDDRIGKWCDNLAICSCGGCGNQRKWVGKTLQERKVEQSEIDRLKDETSYENYYFDMYETENYFSSWCMLCDREFVGVCGCGYVVFSTIHIFDKYNYPG